MGDLYYARHEGCTASLTEYVWVSKQLWVLIRLHALHTPGYLACRCEVSKDILW
jgi:hypothetical protein